MDFERQVIFATRNENKLRHYRSIFDRVVPLVKIISMNDVEAIVRNSTGAERFKFHVEAEKMVGSDGTAYGNSLRKALNIIEQIRRLNIGDFLNATVISDDYICYLESLVWGVDRQTQEKGIFLKSHVGGEYDTFPFPGLDIRQFVDSFRVASEQGRIGLSDGEYDTLLHERAIYYIGEMLENKHQESIAYCNVLTLARAADKQFFQFKGEQKGKFIYPPIKGPSGYGMAMATQLPGFATTNANLPYNDYLQSTAEYKSVIKAREVLLNSY
ncbi:hypothetical protein BTA51_09135 [Hahella sp. CCB-MM4]|uniref:hypothetical protein n=1 Tax=Hahella sp. (strain CCB-MM4) TaxID=1926491 RepID=UPI000B9A5813|nr:hypothetical protein [Hahella sp. CCB-MM4]OZG73934.1 hypothetical protein BTA51_09135 [Hahella sp. CCB-MM4]